MKSLGLILFSIFLTKVSVAGVCNPAPEGTQKASAGVLSFCDGGQWVAMGDGNATTDTCTAADLNKQKYALDSMTATRGMLVCDGSVYQSLKVTVTATACTVPGKQKYDTGLQTMMYCSDALVWVDMHNSFGLAMAACATHGTQPACDADHECAWVAGACQSCACNR